MSFASRVGSPQDVGKPHEGQQFLELAARVADPDPTPNPPDRQLNPGQGLDGYPVRLDESPDVTDHQLGVASLRKRAGSPAERWNVLGRDRAGEDQSGRTPLHCHPSTRPDRPWKLSAGPMSLPEPRGLLGR